MESIKHKSGGRVLGYTFALAFAALLLPAAAGHGFLTSAAFAKDSGGDGGGHDSGDHDSGDHSGSGGGESEGGDHSGSGGDSSRGGGDDGGDDHGGDSRGGDDDGDRNGAEHVDSATGAKAERNGDDIEVVYASGIKEEIQGGRYEMKDARGRTVTERRATAADRKRLSSMLP